MGALIPLLAMMGMPLLTELIKSWRNPEGKAIEAQAGLTKKMAEMEREGRERAASAQATLLGLSTQKERESMDRIRGEQRRQEQAAPLNMMLAALIGRMAEPESGGLEQLRQMNLGQGGMPFRLS